MDEVEDAAYLTEQIITCIGNKRALLPQIGGAVEVVKRQLGKGKLRVLDAFSGSGVVARYLKAHSSFLASNDIERYAQVAAECYLTNRSDVDSVVLDQIVRRLNAEVDNTTLARGFIEELYAPGDAGHIRPGERVFYTPQNARRLDNYRRLIGEVPSDMQPQLLGPLLSEASVHANTAGVFKGFYKDSSTGIGKYGGTNGDAMTRIMEPIVLNAPVLSGFECDVSVSRKDANQAVKDYEDLDLAYFDPPYNQHPYGSNYFMLNLLVDYRRPERISKVSGIPVDWQRSDYNVRAKATSRFADLVSATDARFLLVSFNDEGFISPEEMRRILADQGSIEEVETLYNTYRGSRNLRGRSIHVTERLFLVERR
tara:strand:+ start:796 stop:1902 length:1107 start_codon:yes stop_codon:yes gene_type:complete